MNGTAFGGLAPPPRWLWLALAAAIFATAAWLRVYHLGHGSFWVDEAYSLYFASLPPAEIWGVDTHPPLYYLLLHHWIDWAGDDEFRLRLSSVLFSLATLPAVYLLGRRLGGSWLGLAAAYFFAVSPFAVEYAQELRMYALLGCAGAWALVGLAALLADPDAAAGPLRRRLGAWLLLAGGTLVALYTHNLGVLLPLTTLVLVLVLWWRHPARPRLARNWLLVHLAVLLLWAPYWPALLQQVTQVEGWFWIPEPSLRRVLFSQIRIDFGARSEGLWLWSAVAGFLALTILGLLALPRRPWVWMLLLCMLLPPATALAIGGAFRPIYLPRPLIWTQIPAAVLIGAGTVAALAWRPWHRRWLGLLLVLGVMLCNAYSLWHLYHVTTKLNWRGYAQLVLDETGPDDLVVVPFSGHIALQHYLRRLAPAAGDQPPELAGSFRRIPIVVATLVLRLPERDRFYYFEIPWGQQPVGIEPMLALRFPCHEAMQHAERYGVLLWRYQRQPGCTRAFPR